MAEVILRNIFKRINGVEFLKDLNLEAADGAFCVLAGPAASGKTLLLRIIAGLEDINKGDILMDNVSIKNESPKKRDIAMVFQNFALYPAMTVYENMAFGLKIKSFKRKDIFARICEAAEMLNIENILGKYPKEISEEEKQRTAIGRALVKKPKVFLFDEPLSNVNLQSRAKIRLELKKLQKRLKSTFIYATRDKTEALSLADTICLLREGTVEQISETSIIYENPINKFTADFLSSPSMNFFQIDVMRKANGAICFSEGNFDLLLTEGLKEKFNIFLGQKLIVGIRPEHIYLKYKSIMSDEEKNSYSFKGKIELIEPLGSKTNLHLNTGKHKFIVEINFSNTFREEEEIELVMDYNKMYVFNSQDGARIV